MSVVGVSLGGLIATLLAAELELDRVIAVAPFCDPATTLSQRPPTPSLRHLGMIGEYSGSWGPDRASAGRFLQSTLAPLVARNLTPRTPGDRITLVRAMQDLVVGPDPVTELATAWQTDLWTYPARSHDCDERRRDRAPDRGPRHHDARRTGPVRRRMTTARPALRREGLTRERTPVRRSGRRRTPTLPGLAALIDAVAAEGELIAAVPGEPDTIEQSSRLVSIVLDGGLTLTLEVDGVPAGHVMVQRRAGQHYAHVGEIAILVSNAQRGAGLGRALMEMAIGWARAVGLAKLSLRVFPDNQRAIALYRSLGFEDEGLVRGEVRMPSGDRDMLLMGLALDGAGHDAPPWYPARRMSDSRPIGVFDSGVGGLTVLREIRRQMPAEGLIYVADLEHFPYGPRSQTSGARPGPGHHRHAGGHGHQAGGDRLQHRDRGGAARRARAF